MAATFARIISRNSTSSSTSTSVMSPDTIFSSRRFAVYEPLYLVHRHSATATTPTLRRLSLVDKYGSLSTGSIPTEPHVLLPAEPTPMESYVFVPINSAPYNPLAAIDACKPALQPAPPRMPTIGVSNSTSFHLLGSLENSAAVIQANVTTTNVVNYLIHLPDFGLNPRVRRMAATAATSRRGRNTKRTVKAQRTPLQRRLLQALYFCEFLSHPCRVSRRSRSLRYLRLGMSRCCARHTLYQ